MLFAGQLTKRAAEQASTSSEGRCSALRRQTVFTAAKTHAPSGSQWCPGPAQSRCGCSMGWYSTGRGSPLPPAPAGCTRCPAGPCTCARVARAKEQSENSAGRCTQLACCTASPCTVIHTAVSASLGQQLGFSSHETRAGMQRQNKLSNAAAIRNSSLDQHLGAVACRQVGVRHLAGDLHRGWGADAVNRHGHNSRAPCHQLEQDQPAAGCKPAGCKPAGCKPAGCKPGC